MQDKIKAMRIGGQALAEIKRKLRLSTQVGTSFLQIEKLAQQLIAQAGMKPSFSTVADYKWATCIMKNDALCHGIPDEQIVNDGDLISIDVGLICQGFHLDTSITFGVGNLSRAKQKMLNVGWETLHKAINRAKVGTSVYQISKTIEDNLLTHNFGAVYQLTGHGVGEKLHQDPSIPCVADSHDRNNLLYHGQTLAIEVMCTTGKPDLIIDDNGWTYRTLDGSLSGLFEDTILVTDKGPEVLTD